MSGFPAPRFSDRARVGTHVANSLSARTSSMSSLAPPSCMSGKSSTSSRVTAKPAARNTKSTAKPRAHGRGWNSSLRSHKAMARQRAAAIVIGAVGVVLTGLSLTHQTHGVELITHTGQVEAGAWPWGLMAASLV
jgi:hypothetical protein